jgi:predicted RNA-binding Zn-ribbon protein involved in translation (DUF1610 family)
MSDDQKKCGTCGAVAVVKERDAFYLCAKCWLKVNKRGHRSHEQSTLR